MTNDPTSSEEESKRARAEGVRRALSGEDPPADTVQPGAIEDADPDDADPDDFAPDDVGESITRRGEDVVTQDGKEPGRIDTGTDGSFADRPTGTSTARDRTGIDPQDADDSPLP
jgi:hypothetical protein